MSHRSVSSWVGIEILSYPDSRGPGGHHPDPAEVRTGRIEVGGPCACYLWGVGAGVEFTILGPFEVRVDGEAVDSGGVRQRALLAILVLHRNEVVSTDRLIDEMWGEDPPATALHTVQVFVSRLRRMLGLAGNRLVTRPPGYVLEIDADEIDAERCERLYARARTALATGDPARAEELLRDALALWRGAPLAEYTYERFAEAAIARLEELRLSCRAELIEAELAMGRQEEVVPELEALVRQHPLRERLRGQLMLALYRCGRQAEALEAFQQTRRMLIDELAVEPSDALRELEQAILRQETSLQLPSPRSVSSGAPVDLSPGMDLGQDEDRIPPPNAGLDRGRPPEIDAPRPARKVVTALFCEVSCPATLDDSSDPEVLREVIDRLFAEMRAAIKHHGGTVQSFTHDAMSAVFGVPQLHEDDAVRAVRAAAEIRDRLPAVGKEFGVTPRCRAGISTGLVLVGAGENVAIGHAVNVAASLGDAATLGEILLGSDTLQLVRDAVEVERLDPVAVKSKPQPVAPFRLLGVDPLAPGVARRLDVPLVDRHREMRALRDAWKRVVEESGCHLFTVLGSAGVGKSRLVAELLTEVADEASVLRGRCLHYGEGITFWPLIEALTPAGKPVQPVLERLSGGGAATPEELFWEVRRLFESLAAERPVILHIDDLHWAEPMLLDLLDHVVDLSRGAPIQLLCTARPELFEDRPAWAGGKLNATTLLLESLGTVDSETLLDLLDDGHDSAVRERIVVASEGNPLFLEEMAALARERETIAVPATIQALITARLERLTYEERELLECGAVEGQVFHRRVLVALAGEGLAARVQMHLAGLIRKEIIRPHPATIAGDDAFSFRHVLIRDATYDALPKHARADLHGRLARWLEATTEELVERDELAGWHLEQAVRYRRELGRPIDPALAVAAAEHLHVAARRARERSDTAAARKLLERGLALAPEGDGLRVRIGVDLAEQLIEAGELGRADELLSMAERDPENSELAVLSRLEWLIRVRPQDATRTIRATLPGVLEHLTRAGDERGIARAHLAERMVHVLESRATPAAEQARLAAEHARHAGDEGLRSRALGLYVTSIMYGQQDAGAIAQELDRIARDQPGSYLAARVDLARGEVARLEGRFDDARRLMRRAIEGFQALGMPENEAACEQDLARMELCAGDPTTALASLLRSDQTLVRLGERSRRSTAHAHMAQAHELLGNRDAALAAIELAEKLGAAEDVLNYVITHQVRARLALADGDGNGARRWARSAVDYSMLTDYVVFQAAARLELARVESALAQPQEAASDAQAALELFSRKGDRTGAEQSRTLLDELAALA
jgi:DNA-binding SARP family transcriptional activator/class 3 adenylate cyclase